MLGLAMLGALTLIGCGGVERRTCGGGGPAPDGWGDAATLVEAVRYYESSAAGRAVSWRDGHPVVDAFLDGDPPVMVFMTPSGEPLALRATETRSVPSGGGCADVVALEALSLDAAGLATPGRAPEDEVGRHVTRRVVEGIEDLHAHGAALTARQILSGLLRRPLTGEPDSERCRDVLDWVTAHGASEVTLEPFAGSHFGDLTCVGERVVLLHGTGMGTVLDGQPRPISMALASRHAPSRVVRPWPLLARQGAEPDNEQRASIVGATHVVEARAADAPTRWPLWLGFGLGLATAAGGGALLVHAEMQADELADLERRRQVPEPTSLEVEQGLDDQRIVGATLLGVGLVATGTFAALLALDEPEREPDLWVVPVSDTHVFGLMLGGAL